MVPIASSLRICGSVAMILFPAVQNKAQEEIDSVVGQERSPRFEDYDALVRPLSMSIISRLKKVKPYVQALIKEVTRLVKRSVCVVVIIQVFRWRCIAPTGVPHATTKDDVYQGMFIPKGATVYANI
jgi:hypothetical protein